MYSLSNVNDKSEEIAKGWLPRVRFTNAINTMTSDYRILQYRHVVLSSPAAMKAAEVDLQKKDDEIKATFAEYANHAANPERKQKILDADADWRQYVKDSAGMIELSRQGKTDAAIAVMVGDAQKQYDMVVGGLLQLSKSAEENANKASEEGDAIYTYAFSILAICIVIAIAIVMMSMIWITRKINGAMAHTLGVVNQIADGDLHEKVAIHSDDEFGMLATACNKMIDNLKELLMKIQKTSEQVAASSEELTASAEQSAQVTDQVAQSVTEVAGESVNQSTAVDQMLHIMEKVTEELGKTVQAIALTADKSNQAVEISKNGNATIDHAVNQMRDIEVTVNKSAEVVTKLGQRSQEIGQIVDTISGIAGQTNLLALNAAIEAARAGEQGKGFAVVAEEVRKLAEQSQVAAKQIAQLIAQIQKDTEEAVVAMNLGTKEVQAGTKVVDTAGKAFEEILQIVDIVNGQAQDISRTMEGLAGGAQQITATAQSLDQASMWQPKRKMFRQQHKNSQLRWKRLRTIVEILRIWDKSCKRRIVNLSYKEITMTV